MGYRMYSSTDVHIVSTDAEHCCQPVKDAILGIGLHEVAYHDKIGIFFFDHFFLIFFSCFI